MLKIFIVSSSVSNLGFLVGAISHEFLDFRGFGNFGLTGKGIGFTHLVGEILAVVIRQKLMCVEYCSCAKTIARILFVV